MAEPGSIVVAGEALVDLVLTLDGEIAAHPGGGPFNAARTAGRLGAPTAFLGTLSRDAFGARMRRWLHRDGVRFDEALLVDVPTTLALAEIGVDGSAQYQFYFERTSAPALTPERAAAALPDHLHSLHVGTLGLVLEPMASTLEAMLSAMPPGAIRSLDPNCRVSAIDDLDAYRERLVRCIAGADLVKLSDEDARVIAPDGRPLETARDLLARGPRLVILTRGADGAMAISADWTVEIPAPVVDVVDTVGAGDAFAGGFLAHWSRARLGVADLTDRAAVLAAARFAAQVAAVVCSRAGADPPRLSELAASSHGG